MDAKEADNQPDPQEVPYEPSNDATDTAEPEAPVEEEVRPKLSAEEMQKVSFGQSPHRIT
jgi:hypothetical protein